jgi:predicted Zn-ribbon and HTH transcriptional regulator
MTYLWKFEKDIYAYQTEDKVIANKMKRRGYELFNEGMNCNHWVYHTRKESIRDAKRTLKALTLKDPKYNESTEVWEC